MKMYWQRLLMLLLFCIIDVSATNETENDTASHAAGQENQEHEEPEGCHGAEGNNSRFKVASIEWDEVQTSYGICTWIMIATLAKLGFHYTRLPEVLPESCLLIIIGFAVGGIISINPDVFPPSLSSGLDTDLFFLFLLPPIMLEAGYFMPSRSFFDNIGTILLYAVIGTLFNTMAIGFSLYGISSLGWYGNETSISLLECLTFSSLISAVDPVAVLAVFEEIHVNEVLYILVFGESLLNDAVTVVLYRMFESFNAIGADNLIAVDYVAGFFSFFVVAIGGVAIGLLFGFLTAVLTRFTHKARVIEPIFVFAMSYMAYLTAEMFRLSSILAIVFCAMFMKPYVEANISQKSHTTIKYFMKMLSSVSETIIFIFLGVTTLVDLSQHQWNTVFVICTLVFCLLYRTIGVIIQTWVANRFRLARIAKTEQFIMAYGGLRGAIAFSLVALLCAQTVVSKPVMFTTCIVVVMFTVFIQGTTIKPLVNKLHVKKAVKHKPSMNEEIYERLSDHLMVGIEEILGQYGHHHWRDKWEHFNTKFIEPLLVLERNKVRDPKILEVFSKLNEKDAKDYIKTHGSFAIPHDQSMSNMLRNKSSDMLQTVPSRPSFSGLPVNDSMPCLDMQQMGTGVPKKHVKESSSHHLNLLATSMFKPQKLNNHRRSRYMDSDIHEPQKLMHRSMKLQLHRMSHKQHPRHRSKPNLVSLAVHNEHRFHSKQLAEKNHNSPSAVPASRDYPVVVITPDEDEDEGITFKARDTVSVDEPDHSMEACSPTACEKTLPWKTESCAEISARAEVNPHEFSPDGPPTPIKTPPVDIPFPSSDHDDKEHLTAAGQLPWRSTPIEDVPVAQDQVDSAAEQESKVNLLINGEANDGDRETRF